MNITTKPGELLWATINGGGKKDLQNRDIYTVDIKLSHDAAKPVVDAINEMWENYTPAKGPKKLKSLGYKEKEDGVLFTFKTYTTYTSKKTGELIQKEILVYNAKAQRIDFKDKIGNGSVGCVSGSAEIYDAGPAAQGVTLYLNSIQLIKLIKYEADSGFEEQDGEFVGVEDNDDGFVAQAL